MRSANYCRKIINISPKYKYARESNSDYSHRRRGVYLPLSHLRQIARSTVVGTYLRTMRTEMLAIQVRETSLLSALICIPASRMWHDTTRYNSGALHKYENAYLRLCSLPVFLEFVILPGVITRAFFRERYVPTDTHHRARPRFMNIQASQCRRWWSVLKNRQHNFRGDMLPHYNCRGDLIVFAIKRARLNLRVKQWLRLIPSLSNFIPIR